jgi:N-acetyl-gamma-glutamyl-phosphate reductase
MKRVAIFGASGYSGLELTEILRGHPRAEAHILVSDRLALQFKQSAAADGAQYLSVADSLANMAQIDVACLCTPADVSFPLAQQILNQGVPVIDLSGAYRLRAEDRTLHYPPTSANATALHRPDEYTHEYARGVYGLPELFRDDLGPAALKLNSVLIANPGCYATAAAIALAPAVESGLVHEAELNVTAMSGVTGAGRSTRQEHSFAELAEDARAYKVLSHQHTPEITMALQRLTEAEVRLTLTPHLVPLRRGILLTAHLSLRSGTTEAMLLSWYRKRYASEAFVQLVPRPDLVSLRKVVGTNNAVLGLSANAHTAVVVLALDNLVKGAAGQAVQNMNRLFDFPETEGLLNLRRFVP